MGRALARRRDDGPVALLARQQVEHRPAEQQRVGGARGERRGAALAQPPQHGGPHVARLPRQPLRGALHEPRVAHPAAQPERPERRRVPGVPLRDRMAGEQARRREHQHLQRALDVGGALGEQPRGEHVQLAGGRPADHVAPGGGRGQPALQGDPGLRRVELGRRAVQHHRQLAHLHLEALLQPFARVLELGQHALGVRRVALVVARDEGLRCGLGPGHPVIKSGSILHSSTECSNAGDSTDRPPWA